MRSRSSLPLILFALACCGPPGVAAPTPSRVLAPSPTSVPTYTPTPHHTPAPTPETGSTLERAPDGMVMVYVPAGPFLMGSPEADLYAHIWEKPAHTVYVDGFWIDRTEVTNAQYRLCVRAVECSEPGFGDSARFGADAQPVTCVSWQQAQSYCEWAGGRLPTEAEWEKAARGTNGQLYPWGSLFDGSLANFCDRNCGWDYRDESADDRYADTAPVGSYPGGASPYGALDMAGNVWEWVYDWYGKGTYDEVCAHNPQGPASGTFRLLRGGSWRSGPTVLRTAYRFRAQPEHSGDRVIGFRCAVPAGP